jgi:hypothetical protein
MPICPRCGKILCTNQALTYHLGKKFKCLKNSCSICKAQFSTSLQRDIHLRYCKAQKLFTTFCKYESENQIYILDHQMNILKCNNTSRIDTMYNCDIHNSPFSKNCIKINGVLHDVAIFYVEDLIVAIQRPMKQCSAG